MTEGHEKVSGVASLELGSEVDRAASVLRVEEDPESVAWVAITTVLIDTEEIVKVLDGSVECAAKTPALLVLGLKLDRSAQTVRVGDVAVEGLEVEQAVYWVDVASDELKSAPLGGGTVSQLWQGTDIGGVGLAVDGSHLYWNDVASSTAAGSASVVAWDRLTCLVG